MRILKRISYHKGLLLYTFLNCIDKALNFVLPLIILIICDDKQTYNEIEYVYSVALMVLVFIEIQRYYLFYGYRLSSDKDEFTQVARNVCDGICFILFVLGLFLWIIFYNYYSFLIWIVVRTLHLFILNFYNYYYRLIDNPCKIFYISIGISLITIALIYLSNENLINPTYLFLFFVVPLVFITYYAVFRGLKYLFMSGLRPMWKCIKQALLYSWPIVVNMFFFSIINNYGKIFAFNHMSQQEMYEFAFSMRISLIILMIHTSFWAYYSKNIYLQGFIKPKMLFYYTVVLLLAVTFSCFVIFVWNYFWPSKSLPLNLNFGLLMLYIFILCYKATYEIYFSIWNKNVLLLLFSLLSCIIYILILKLPERVTLLTLSIALVISMFVNLLLVFFYVKIKANCVHIHSTDSV